MSLEHGGDLISAKKIYPGEILDLSVNINPLGAPIQVVRAAEEALQRVGEYPDPACRHLRMAIAQRDGVSPEEVFCGNGAAEVIFRLAMVLRPEAALLTAPTFSEYENALAQLGCDCRFHRLSAENNFDVTEKILEEIRPPVQLVILCSPNNPTGRLVSERLLLLILQRCREIGAHLMVDECFLPLACEGRGMAGALKEWPELFLLRAFTKSYAVPGLRLGYGLGTPALIERMARFGSCWNVSGPAQEAGIACCGLPQWPQAGRELLSKQRPLLTEEMRKLGCHVVDSAANYLLFRLPGAEDLKERLLQHGILIRSCADYRGLGSDWYRVAVKREEENQRFLRALCEEVNGHREVPEEFIRGQECRSALSRPLRFPLFLDLSGKKVVLVGGGTVAARRIDTLRLFHCDIVVVSPELKVRKEDVTWIRRAYRPGDLDGAYLAIAATSDRRVNRQVGEDARRLGIPVSVADCEEECNFYFPAVCIGKELVVGVVSSGREHDQTARMARKIRTLLEETK